MSDMCFFIRSDRHGQVWMSLDGNDDDALWWPVWHWDERPDLYEDETEECFVFYPPDVVEA